MNSLSIFWSPVERDNAVLAYDNGYLYLRYAAMYPDEVQYDSITNPFGDIISCRGEFIRINGYFYRRLTELTLRIAYYSTPMLLYRYINGNIVDSFFSGHPVWSMGTHAGSFYLDDTEPKIMEFAVALLPKDEIEYYTSHGFTATKTCTWIIRGHTVTLTVGSGSFYDPAVLSIDDETPIRLKHIYHLKEELREAGIIEFFLGTYDD